MEETVGLQALKLLREHLVGNVADGVPNLRVPERGIAEIPQDENLPLPLDHAHSELDRARKATILYGKRRHHAVPPFLTEWEVTYSFVGS
jgi:hypothetical protein